MLQSVKAVVLQSIKYGESGMVVQAYTNTSGRQSFLVHGVRKKRSKINAYLLQPLHVLDMVAYIKEHRDLHKVKELRPAFPLHSLAYDVRKSSIAVFLGEVINRSVRETEANKALFEYLEQAIQWLEMSETGVQNFHLIFLIQFTKFIGIFPQNASELEYYSRQAGFDIASLLNHSLGKPDGLEIDRSTKNAVVDQLLSFYRNHIEGFGAIKSLEILREIFG